MDSTASGREYTFVRDAALTHGLDASTSPLGALAVGSRDGDEAARLEVRMSAPDRSAASGRGWAKRELDRARAASEKPVASLLPSTAFKSPIPRPKGDDA